MFIHSLSETYNYLCKTDSDNKEDSDHDTDCFSSNSCKIPFIHMNLDKGRKSADILLRKAGDGDYLVRPSSNNRDYAISMKMNNKVLRGVPAIV